MPYFCAKQLTVGGVEYHPGEIIPDGAILPERSGKLLRNGYIMECRGIAGAGSTDGAKKLYTQEEVEAILSEAIEEAVDNTVSQTHAGEANPDGQGAICIQVRGAADGQPAWIPVTADEIQQVFSVMQLGADESARAISAIESENVLILLHAADSRKMVKNAAKDRADKLFSPDGKTNESVARNAITDTSQGG